MKCIDVYDLGSFSVSFRICLWWTSKSLIYKHSRLFHNELIHRHPWNSNLRYLLLYRNEVTQFWTFLYMFKLFCTQADLCTGGPRYMRTFYLRIRVYAIFKRRQNSLYANILNTLPRVYAILNLYKIKITIFQKKIN